MDERTLQIQACMYQYSRAIYRSIKDLVDPYVTGETRLQYRREVLEACEQTMERLAKDPLYFAKPDRALFQDIRRYFPITCQAQVAWAVREGVAAAVVVHREPDRGRRVRRRDRPLPRDHAQGQAVPAHAAPRARLLPVAPAPRALEGRGVARHAASLGVYVASAIVSRVSHDTDKLIRQLSLVAFLMAERRAVTARDIKGQVEGYQEMSDEAFARRFYSDRAELIALGVPLHSQRDEYTGEELYNMRSERYFLPPLELTDDELAALQTCLYLLEGKFAYAEPLRLALQNLALGRAGLRGAAERHGESVEVVDPDYSVEMQGRLGKLEAAISKQRTVKFPYWSISRDEERERTVNPYALFQDGGAWYVVGLDLGRRGRAHLPRLAHSRRDPLRHAPRAGLPAAGRVRRRPLPRPAAVADRRRRPARRGSRSPATRPGGSSAPSARRSRTASS